MKVPLPTFAYKISLTLILVLAVACSRGAAEPSPSPQPTSTSAPASSSVTETRPTESPKRALEQPLDEVRGLLSAYSTPDRDLYSLTQRLRSNEPLPRVVNPTPPKRALGDRETFSVTNLDTYENFTARAVLRYVGPNSYWYVEEGVNVSQEALQRSAGAFQDDIYPTVTRLFGPIISPGIDNDPALTILIARIPGVAGYYSSLDEYPRAVNRFSNQREMVYMNIDAVQPGGRQFDAVLAHELQHAVHANGDPSEDTWVNEGLAELAADLAGYGPRPFTAFTGSPDTQLTGWSDQLGENGAHYSAAYLFMRYLYDHFGGQETLRSLVDEPKDGVAGIDAYLSALGKGMDFWDVFAKWTVANYLDSDDLEYYGYPTLTIRMGPIPTQTQGFDGVVHQFGTDYIELALPQGDSTISFAGDETVRLLPNEAISGSYQWWGGRGDSIDTTLTRAFDLSGLSKATLTFSAWYDMEKTWDYAYVTVSVDGGRKWTTLPGRHTTDEDVLGNNLGHGYTSKSGGGKEPEWVKEEIDLSAYAGRDILLRFEVVNDEAVNLPGFAIDDISIPELGFYDDAEADAGWEARGFARIDNVLPQEFIVQLIEQGSQTRVRRMELGPGQSGELTVRGYGKGVEKVILLMSGATPITSEPAPYRVSIATALPGQ